jgi:hypothetical protein
MTFPKKMTFGTGSKCSPQILEKIDLLGLGMGFLYRDNYSSKIFFLKFPEHLEPVLKGGKLFIYLSG